MKKSLNEAITENAKIDKKLNFVYGVVGFVNLFIAISSIVVAVVISSIIYLEISKTLGFIYIVANTMIVLNILTFGILKSWLRDVIDKQRIDYLVEKLFELQLKERSKNN